MQKQEWIQKFRQKRSTQDKIVLRTFLYDFLFQFNSFRRNPDTKPEFSKIRRVKPKVKIFCVQKCITYARALTKWCNFSVIFKGVGEQLYLLGDFFNFLAKTAIPTPFRSHLEGVWSHLKQLNFKF